MNESVKSKVSIDRVSEDAARLGLQITIRRLDRSTRTAQEAADACGCDVAQIVKSLVFEDDATGALVLLLVSGGHNVDPDHVARHYGLRLRRADPRRVRDETGFAIGGVAPIGHLQPVRTLMDETLMGFKTIWAAAGRPDSVFSVEPAALQDAIQAEIVSVCGADQEERPNPSASR